MDHLPRDRVEHLKKTPGKQVATLISINFSPKEQPQLPKKMVHYVFQATTT